MHWITCCNKNDIQNAYDCWLLIIDAKLYDVITYVPANALSTVAQHLRWEAWAHMKIYICVTISAQHGYTKS